MRFLPRDTEEARLILSIFIVKAVSSWHFWTAISNIESESEWPIGICSSYSGGAEHSRTYIVSYLVHIHQLDRWKKCCCHLQSTEGRNLSYCHPCDLISAGAEVLHHCLITLWGRSLDIDGLSDCTCYHVRLQLVKAKCISSCLKDHCIVWVEDHCIVLYSMGSVSSEEIKQWLPCTNY